MSWQVGEAMNWDEKAEDYATAHHTYEHRTMTANAFGYSKFVAGAKWQREQLQDTESVTRLANHLCNADQGETLDEHDKDCPVPNCGLRAAYMRDARDALAALMGDDQ